MTTSPLDSLDERIRRAIAERRLLEIRYKRVVRLMEPHDYGVIDGTERLLTFQLRGPDSGKGAVGWRLLDVVKLESCVVTDQTFAGSRGQSHQQHYQGLGPMDTAKVSCYTHLRWPKVESVLRLDLNCCRALST